MREIKEELMNLKVKLKNIGEKTQALGENISAQEEEINHEPIVQIVEEDEQTSLLIAKPRKKILVLIMWLWLKTKSMVQFLMNLMMIFLLKNKKSRLWMKKY